MRGVGAGLATLPSDFFCQWSIPFPLINFMKNLFMQCLGFPEACCHSDRRCPRLLEENKQDEHMPCHNLWPIIRKLCNFNYIKSRFLNQPQFAELSLSDNYLYLIFSLSLSSHLTQSTICHFDYEPSKDSQQMAVPASPAQD